jgi:hypothetical protein
VTTAGDQRLVDGRLSLPDGPVDRDTLARADDDLLARFEVPECDRLGSVVRPPVRLVDASCRQRREPAECVPPDAALVVVAGRDRHDDDHRDVEVHLGVTEQEDGCAVEIGGPRRDGHEQVHVRVARTSADVRPAEDGVPDQPQHDRREQPDVAEQVRPRGPREAEQETVGGDTEVAGVQKEDVPDHHEHREKAADQQPAAGVRLLVASPVGAVSVSGDLLAASRVADGGLVPESLDQFGEVPDREFVGVVGEFHRPGRVAGSGGEHALVVGRPRLQERLTGRTVHPRHREERRLAAGLVGSAFEAAHSRLDGAAGRSLGRYRRVGRGLDHAGDLQTSPAAELAVDVVSTERGVGSRQVTEGTGHTRLRRGWSRLAKRAGRDSRR